ncbi:MAG: hypothetical protein IPG97_16245 [Microthrixaceae bacterium]|nr:hypothetical protein [Microthrixaceae bacterium]
MATAGQPGRRGRSDVQARARLEHDIAHGVGGGDIPRATVRLTGQQAHRFDGHSAHVHGRQRIRPVMMVGRLVRRRGAGIGEPRVVALSRRARRGAVGDGQRPIRRQVPAASQPGPDGIASRRHRAHVTGVEHHNAGLTVHRRNRTTGSGELVYRFLHCVTGQTRHGVVVGDSRSRVCVGSGAAAQHVVGGQRAKRRVIVARRVPGHVGHRVTSPCTISTAPSLVPVPVPAP